MQGRGQKAKGKSSERGFAGLTFLSRCVVQGAALLVPADQRARWREEWLGELAAAPHNLATLRRALGAPRDAWSTRSANQTNLLNPTNVTNGINHDIRDALRSLRKTPMQTATVVLCLSVGGTLTVGAFSIINGIVAGELAGVQNRSRLVTLHVAHRAQERRHSAPMSLSEFRSLPAVSSGLTEIATEVPNTFAIEANGAAITALGSRVSGGYFPVLGTRAHRGRLIDQRDDSPGAAPVIVIGYALWRGPFGAREDILGLTIQIGSVRYQVIGVAPRDFGGLMMGRIGDPATARPSLWIPLGERRTAFDPAVTVISRLSGQQSIGDVEMQAQSMIAAANAALGEARIAEIRLEPLHLAQLTGVSDVAKFTASMMAVPLIVLAIACANVAGVQMARSMSRMHELAVRVSLGASRWRVTRLLAIETLVLAVGAGLVSWLSAIGAVRLLAGLLPFTPVPDVRVLLFAIVLPVLVTLAAGLYPAWRATGFDVLSGLRLGGRASRSSTPVMRRRLLIVQTALSVFLLVMSLTLARGLQRLPSLIGPSFDDTIVSEVSLGGLGLTNAQVAAARGQITRELAAAPGVTRVGQSEWPVFFGSQAGCWADVSKSEIDAWGMRSAKLVSPEYFDALRLRPTQGRTLKGGDIGAVLVNQSFLDAYPSASLNLGTEIRVRRAKNPSSISRIVGIVPDSYERYPKGLAEPTCYLPLSDSEAVDWFTLYTQTTRPAALGPTLQQILSRVDTRLAVGKSGTINERVWMEYAGLALVTRAIGIISLLALLMAMVGLFGAISHGTTQRLHEFGVRLALGAGRMTLAAGIVRESAVVAIAGVVAGCALATPLAMFFHARLLRTITIADPILIVAVTASVLLVAAGAAIFPARRASAVNPVITLRGE